MKNILKMGLFGIGIVLFLYVGIWQWMICRIYVGPGEMLVITSKFGNKNPDPINQRVVSKEMKGIWRQVRGEGRHFYNPIAYKTNKDQFVIEIQAGEVGIVNSLSGKPLPEGDFLVEKGDFKGILQAPLTPGKWRLNPFAFRVEKVPATIIEPGFVGCVTRQTGDIAPENRLAGPTERGIQANVLQPGIYYLNPREFSVEPVEIGYRRITLNGVKFPSHDSFPIELDISVVWGVLPKNVPAIIKHYGNVDAVIEKVIRPQVESICRIEGSKYGAKDFIEGTTREKFQNTFTSQLEHEAKIRNIAILIGLVRRISVPMEVRGPIQKSKIANEEQATKEQQRLTQVVLNQLEELKADVKKGVREVEAETAKLVAMINANGDKEIARIGAEKTVEVAIVMKEVAFIEAKRHRILGKAQADVTELLRRAEADRFKQNVAAMQSPDAYANYVFVKGIRDDLRIDLRYAGPGTFWTDIPKAARDLKNAAAMKILEKSQGN